MGQEHDASAQCHVGTWERKPLKSQVLVTFLQIHTWGKETPPSGESWENKGPQGLVSISPQVADEAKKSHNGDFTAFPARPHTKVKRTSRVTECAGEGPKAGPAECHPEKTGRGKDRLAQVKQHLSEGQGTV